MELDLNPAGYGVAWVAGFEPQVLAHLNDFVKSEIIEVSLLTRPEIVVFLQLFWLGLIKNTSSNCGLCLRFNWNTVDEF